jgi:hypothetical protein
VREFEKIGPRAQGPPVVWVGRDDGPALVVVDPSGAAIHDELPATWRELAERYQVIWCRVPATIRSLDDIEDVLETLADHRTPADVVASGTACDAAVTIAAQFDDTVRSVLLVDPEPLVTSALSTRAVRTQVVARSHHDERDRVEEPMPLGHPDVVDAIVSALDDIGPSQDPR